MTGSGIRSLAFVFTLMACTLSACTSNDLDKYKENGLIPGEPSSLEQVTSKARVAIDKRDEKAISDALDELAEFLITTSPLWLPVFYVDY